MEKSLFQKIKSEAFLLHTFPFLVILCFCLITYVNFHNLFLFSSLKLENLQKATSMWYNEKAFFMTFYSFFTLFIISCFFLIYSDNFYSKILFYATGLISASLMSYSTDQIFMLKIFIYIAFLICIVYSYARPVHQILSFSTAAFFFILECLPNFISSDESWSHPVHFGTLNTLFSVMLIGIFVSMTIKKLSRNYLFCLETITHQNIVMNQMTELNNRLQEYAKSHGEEAVQNERMRITRDMHDSCGYAFVNITAIIDAIMSNPELSGDKLSDTLLTVRNLASTGLKETRKTLRQIREVESPNQNNLNGIYEIRKIFTQITGINVDIQSGNLKENYGITINSIIMHTLQEGLTNSIRHGRAKNIFVTFWDDVNLLTMVIKDDGIGSKDIVKGIGLAGMEERLSKVMGRLEVTTPKEGGFRLEIQIPLVNIGADELKM